MGKKEQHIKDLNSIIGRFIEDGNTQTLTDYLLSNCNLPGRRANLELAGAFGDVIADHINGENTELWQLCTSFSKITVEGAPVNAPEEFIPFCGAIGIGAIGSSSAEFYEEAIKELRRLANDPRWRMRKAVCFGLQRLLEKRSQATLINLKEWVTGGSLLEMRAAAAGVAEPLILEDEEIAVVALHLHETIFELIPGIEDRKAENFKIMRKALGYTLSVVVCAIPKEGFEFMQRLIASQDTDVLWIVKQNTKKNRLIKKCPNEVGEIEQYLY